MPTALDFKSTLEASGATSWGQNLILETMVMGNLEEWVNEVHYGLGENGHFHFCTCYNKTKKCQHIKICFL